MIPENVSFGTDWNIRAAENPIMNTNISADQLRYYRSKFQNYFFLRNYLRINNIICTSPRCPGGRDAVRRRASARYPHQIRVLQARSGTRVPQTNHCAVL